MLLFRCAFTHNELTSLKNSLPKDGYCIVGEPGERDYYGVIRAVLHERLMDVLSGETLELLEYVDEEEFKAFLSTGENLEIIGEPELIKGFQ